jgi:hypothetical protein
MLQKKYFKIFTLYLLGEYFLQQIGGPKSIRYWMRSYFFTSIILYNI